MCALKSLTLPRQLEKISTEVEVSRMPLQMNGSYQACRVRAEECNGSELAVQSDGQKSWHSLLLEV